MMSVTNKKRQGSTLQSFTLATVSRWSQFADYLGEGVWHIWIGFDHVRPVPALAAAARGARGRRRLVAFGFGLVLGFGFASVLADLGLPQGTLALALVGFNLGVEAGQLAIVTLFLPLAYALRRTWLYRRMIFLGGSALIALLAAVWLLERTLDLKLLSG